MDWDKLKSFYVAANLESVSRAAQQLHLTQSAISRQILALEKKLGATVFNRHARGISLMYSRV